MNVRRKAGVEPVTMFTAITSKGEVHVHPDPDQNEFELDSEVAQFAIDQGWFESAEMTTDDTDSTDEKAAEN